jgi:hypothetical protein
MVVCSGSLGCWTQDEWPSFQCSAKPGRASSLKNKNPPHLLLEHAGAPRAAAPPCAGVASAASPPRVGEASPQQVWAVAPTRVGVAAPPRVRRASAATPPPSPASLMARLTPCACLKKKKILDSIIGDRRRWCWGFLGAAVDEVLGRPGFILTSRRTVRRSVTCLGTRVNSGELLATKIMWSHGDV